MINLFTLQSTVAKIQTEVLKPLYTEHPRQGIASHAELMAQTGHEISKHTDFIRQVCSSTFIAIVFSIVKLLGGAPQLTKDDFDRFTNYVNDGGLEAMMEMLNSDDMEATFLSELEKLPKHVQINAPIMLRKSKILHEEFITEFFIKKYERIDRVPESLRHNSQLSGQFIQTLADKADAFLASKS